MRLDFLMTLAMAIACIGPASAEGSFQSNNRAPESFPSLVKDGHTPRYLKGTPKPTEGEDSAEEEERGWAEVADKLKEAETEGKVEGQTAAASRWESLAAKVKDGQLKNLDTKQTKWQSAFAKLKASGLLKNVDEAQTAKVTDEVAQALKKDPKKWPKLKKALTITFGAALTALIVLGIESMLSK